MKSFDEHFKGAKNHNQEDLKWLLACYYGTMMNLCNEYSYLGDEDLFGLMLESGFGGTSINFPSMRKLINRYINVEEVAITKNLSGGNNLILKF